MKILRAAERASTPWKNGGGVTTEVAVFPPGAGFDDFGWRISIAEVCSGGPFSIFPGVDRKLAVLDGHMSLAVAGRDAIGLSPGSAPAEFPGDAMCEATLMGGPVTDLNVMTRRSAFNSRMKRRVVDGTDTLEHRATVSIAIALTELTIVHDGETYALDARDGLLVAERPDVSRVTLYATAAVGALYWIEVSTAAS